MRTRRQQRYELLRKNGLCGFEAKPLSRVPIKTVPYMKGFVRERWGMLRDALERKLTITQFEAQIKQQYNRQGFLKRNKAGKVVADPWAMLRDFEDRYRDKYPAYESPWEKRRRSLVDFMAKIEQTIASQSQRRLRRAPA